MTFTEIFLAGLFIGFVVVIVLMYKWFDTPVKHDHRASRPKAGKKK